MRNRYSLTAKGMFPETLPPCFTSEDIRRAMRGIVTDIEDRKFRKRSADYIRLSGTKHDGTRRFYGTPHPIPYHHVSSFIHKHWRKFEQQFSRSPFSVGMPRVLPDEADRSVQVTSLSELSSEAQKRLRFAPYVLKTDISQFFPSIYTHSISWAAHGLQASKADTRHDSSALPFNELDWHVRNCQLAQTRGVLVGPDAFRLVAEYIATAIDVELSDAVGKLIVGSARHVDDFYIGLKSEADALIVLSRFREVLQKFELQINDAKTKIFSSLEPINDIWAQSLRRLAPSDRYDTNIQYFLDRAIQISSEMRTSSPIKIALRSLDQIKLYRTFSLWGDTEPFLQRVCFHHPHCIDYVALLVVKRFAIEGDIDTDGWSQTCSSLLERHIALNHHHEIIWLLWLMLACRLEVSEDLCTALIRVHNSHVAALLSFAFVDGRISRKPALKFTNKLSSTDSSWLSNLVARCSGFTKAKFSGDYSEEFEHFATRRLSLVNIQSYVDLQEVSNTSAISRTRYGYDDHEDHEDDDDDDSTPDWLDDDDVVDF